MKKERKRKRYIHTYKGPNDARRMTRLVSFGPILVIATCFSELWTIVVSCSYFYVSTKKKVVSNRRDKTEKKRFTCGPECAEHIETLGLFWPSL